MDTQHKMDDLKKRVTDAIPEFALISDANLREKTVSVWVDAIEQGRWSFAAIEKMPFSIHVENCNISFIEHVRTVCRMCIAVADVLKESYGERSQLNRDHLVSGALLADVGKLLEYEEDGDGGIRKAEMGAHLRHPFTGVALAHAHGVPAEVQHIIATHSKEGELMTRSSESIIFHHADFIDFDLVSKKRPF